MSKCSMGRRGAILGVCLGLGLATRASAQHHEQVIRWSTGMAGATLLPSDAFPADYRALQARIGTTRGVIIQPSTYGTDNSLQLASMQALGPDRFRMVAVVAEDVPDAELRRLDGLGVRGVRFNLTLPGVSPPPRCRCWRLAWLRSASTARST